MINKKFGKLLVIEKLNERGNRRQLKYLCRCDCGKLHKVTGESLRSGKSKSCGCIKKIPPNYEVNREIAIYKSLLHSIKTRAKKKKIEFNIILDDFIFLSKQPCYYCGLLNSNFATDLAVKKWQEVKNKENTYIIIKYNGLDRVDSSKGYTMDNVVPCCKYCNIAKNSMTQEEYVKFINRVYTFLVKK